MITYNERTDTYTAKFFDTLAGHERIAMLSTFQEAWLWLWFRNKTAHIGRESWDTFFNAEDDTFNDFLEER